MRIHFATGNAGKVAEAQSVLGRLGHEVVGSPQRLVEIQAESLEPVALHKAEQLRGRLAPPYFVEDAGLFLDALDGFPGVFSAHAYATIGWQGLLRLLEGVEPERRTARFEAVVAYADDSGAVRTFAGRVDGRIAAAGRGEHGFGFDPVFVPAGQEETFGQMAAEKKDALSHRGRALRALAAYLQRR